MGNRKGEQTKAFIVQKASRLFNCQGYMASSISDIMQETGLRKGGIYNHFGNKEELVLSAFSFSIDTMIHFYSEALAGKQGCMERLLSIVSVFEKLAENELLPGGCPIMNAAIEADDADPLLREKASEAMDRLFGMVRHVLQKGIEEGEVQANVDIEFVATVLISTLEGAIMLSKLYGNMEYMRRAVLHLKSFLTLQDAPLLRKA
ncbi:TetR/AcrR family transcriptional regulator [Paenibacillus sp. SYP-B3998]|uniref:TetR/AcrR family transcriptional regulator n=1 Tax=Paenibacillus sp. SYP-B3998 TaxID=2678564 RepID=A0A6G3ZZ10_9BACL|nr:TetR/AcrR family transcriptional regulator [Paenibacillus sp. SYP-B3998]NEW06811.1 TetR/AcrR family transcriptional regulator [Paenibacillus sp. SYP-B3998]